MIWLLIPGAAYAFGAGYMAGQGYGPVVTALWPFAIALRWAVNRVAGR